MLGLVVMLALVAVLLMLLARAVLGPSLYDRVLAVNMLGTVTVLAIVLIGQFAGRLDMYVDIALVYALINFTGTIAVLRFTHYDAHYEPRHEQEPDA